MEKKGMGSAPILIIVVGSTIMYALRRIFPGGASRAVSLADLVAIVLGFTIGVVLYYKIKYRKKKKKAIAQKGADAALAEIYAAGKRNLTDLRMRAVRIKNSEIRKISQDICLWAEKILKLVQEKPEKVSAVRQFLHYYLPTLGSILEKYVRLEEGGVPDAEMTEKTAAHLRDISAAMQKQYENLFAGELLDLSVEMEALTQACRRDGLLTEEDVTFQDGDKNITLRL